MAAINLKNDIKPISYIKSHAADMLRYVNETKNPLVITQNGEAKAVLVDVDSYQQTENALALLSIIKLSEKDVAMGRTYSVEETFAKIDKKIEQRYGKRA
jgi:prevent-host-death family protein